MITTSLDCQKLISKCFKQIVNECRTVFGSELHYQAMIYHILRKYGDAPIDQLGMNVKTLITNVNSEFLLERINRKNINYQSYGIELIPDLSFYEKAINSDWRRRNYKNTLKLTLYSLEVKASERHKSRISYKEIETDILKIEAQYQETKQQHNKSIGIGLLIVDTAPSPKERITETSLFKIQEFANSKSVDLWYLSQDIEIERLLK